MRAKCFENEVLRMATTTSTKDSGLLDILNPAFEQKTGATIRMLSKGTGGAIKSAINKEVDLIFVHWRTEEDKFITDGYGVNRRDVMFNDFIITGPKDDPARVSGLSNAVEALVKIKECGEVGKTKFFSRGDRSGTHSEELNFWQIAEVKPALLGRGDWYVSTGKGMGETLNETNEAKGYTLTDRGTWLKKRMLWPI